MNAPERFELHDVQSRLDGRDLRIDAVGVKGLRYPVAIRGGAGAVPTIATFAMTVGLPSNARGTHMSRFVELLEAQTDALDLGRFEALATEMLGRLEAPSGAIEMRFPYFVRKTAPASGARSWLDCDACWLAKASGDASSSWMQVMVPATSLCPCSKEISAYGAHNQRSCITISAEILGEMSIEELIGVAERSASCEVYGLLKRADEKHVTERAYDNPRFVEDLVRDAALALRADPRVGAYSVEAENFESIHNHSAYARIDAARR